MELTIKNTSAYTGNVEVIAYNGDKEYARVVTHNEGTPALCSYISECLRGANIIANRPGYLVPIKFEEGGSGEVVEELFDYDILYNKVSATTTDVTNNCAYYTLSFLIPSTILVGVESIEGLRLKGLNRIPYADVKLTSQIPVIANTNLKINWTLKVSCKTASQEV